MEHSQPTHFLHERTARRGNELVLVRLTLLHAELATDCISLSPAQLTPPPPRRSTVWFWISAVVDVVSIVFRFHACVARTGTIALGCGNVSRWVIPVTAGELAERGSLDRPF